MSSALNKAPKSISPSFRARLYLPCPIICLASLRFAYTLPVGTCLTLVSILWCFNGFPQIRIQVLDNTKSGHFSHEKATPQGGNYSFEICDLDGSGSISCIDHNRSIPSNKRFENTTVRGTSKIRNDLEMRSLRISPFFARHLHNRMSTPSSARSFLRNHISDITFLVRIFRNETVLFNQNKNVSMDILGLV